MKKIFLPVIVLAALLAIHFSCSKDITGRTDNAPALNPSDIDINAGSWKTIVLKKPDTFAVSAPAAVNSPGYVGELNEVKGLQQNLSEKDKQIIRYWGAGSVLRWNEILRDLVAKHNLPPYQNEDGSYPAPNVSNPFAY